MMLLRRLGVSMRSTLTWETWTAPRVKSRVCFQNILHDRPILLFYILPCTGVAVMHVFPYHFSFNFNFEKGPGNQGWYFCRIPVKKLKKGKKKNVFLI